MRRRLLFLAVGLCLAAVLGEIVLRVFLVDDGMLLGKRALPPYGATTNPAQRRWVADWRKLIAEGTSELGLGRFDSELGTTHRASAESLDGLYRTNALGARGPREYAPQPPVGTLRLLCFGDSFTFCSEVTDDASWESSLEAKTSNCEAINFGVGGYGTDQALMRYQRRRGDVAGHIVTIGIMLENIGRNVNRYRPLYYPETPVVYAKPRFVLGDDGQLVAVRLPFADFGEFLASVDDGSVLSTLGTHEHWTSTAPFGGSIAALRVYAAFQASRARQHRQLWEASAQPFHVTVRILQEFHASAMDDGAAAAPVLIFPAESDLEALLTEGSRYWSSLTDELGVPYLDLAVPLAELCTASGRAPAALYAGGHLNAEANALVADTLLAWLESRTELPIPPKRR